MSESSLSEGNEWKRQLLLLHTSLTERAAAYIQFIYAYTTPICISTPAVGDARAETRTRTSTQPEYSYLAVITIYIGRPGVSFVSRYHRNDRHCYDHMSLCAIKHNLDHFVERIGGSDLNNRYIRTTRASEVSLLRNLRNF